MGLLSFVKGAGRKLFGIEAKAAEKETAVINHLNSFNLGSKDIKATWDDETDTVTLRGTAESMLERKRIVATIGNVEGVAKVKDLIQVEDKDDNEVADNDSIRYYEVKSGDTLSGIATQMYGDASKYPQIFKANKPMLSDPDKIYPGQKLVIPAE